jgi:hypothetical protein
MSKIRNNAGVCRMNHDAKHTSGIFRRRPSTSSTTTSSSRLAVTSRAPSSGSLSCPTSPRKQLPPVGSSTSLNTVLNPTSSTMHECSSRLQRSSSNYSNYRSGGGGGGGGRSAGYSGYTGRSPLYDGHPSYDSHLIRKGSPSAPTSAHSSRVDLNTIGRPPTGSVIYLKNTSSSGSRLSLVSRSSSLSSPTSSPKHRQRQ